MSDLNKPSEQPTGDLRQEVLTNASTMLENMKEHINENQRNLFLEMIKNENLSEESLKKIDLLLDGIEREYEKGPTKALEILDRMIEAGSDGEISAEDIQSLTVGATPEMPESMSKISGMIEKMTTMANQLGEQLGSLGSGTIKMLAGFFGSNSLFGKICEYLKDQPKAQIAYLQKKLLEQGKEIAPDTTFEQILGVLKNQVIQGKNIERRGKQSPTYDIVQHVEQLMANLDSTENVLSVEDFQSAGEKTLEGYTTEIAGLTPAPAIAAEPKKERERKEVTARIETKITENETALLAIEKITDGALLEINGKKAEIKKIGESAVTSVALLEANATDPAAVILTLADATKVQIDATELRTRALDTSKKDINAKNLTTNNDMTFEILFA